MFGPPSSALDAGINSLLVAAFLLVLGYLVAWGTTARLDLDAVTRWGLAFPGVVFFGLVVMLLHIVSQGGVLASPSIDRAFAASTFIVLAGLWLRFRRSTGTFDWWTAGLLIALMALAVLAWCTPVFRVLPLDSRGDTTRHMGWASELLNGSTLPSGPLSGNIPNGYPWLYHGLVALVANLTPGGRAYDAEGPLQILQVTGSVAALFALGRRLRGPVCGAAAALLGAISGGFGFFIARGPALVTEHVRTPHALAFMGDFFYKRSYNFAFANIAPAFPRDLTYALFPAFLLLLLIGVTRKERMALAGAGVVLGLQGLIGAEAFVVGMAVTVAMFLFPGSVRRRWVAGWVVAPALGLWALWSVPLLLAYVRLGGFRDLVSPPVSLPLQDILATWGITTPLAVVGAALCIRRNLDAGVKLALAVIASAAVPILLSSVLPTHLHGFTTLSRPHRYWPLLFAGVVLFGALGVAEVIRRARKASVVLAIAAAVATVGFAIPSPLLASAAFPHVLPPDPLLTKSLEGDPATVLNVLAPEQGEEPIVAAIPQTQRAIFSYTGYRLLAYLRVGHKGQFGFTRWRDIFARIGGPVERLAANAELISPRTPPGRWLSLVHRYDVDVVVRRSPPDVPGLCVRRSTFPPGLVVIWVAGSELPSPCGAVGRAGGEPADAFEPTGTKSSQSVP